MKIGTQEITGTTVEIHADARTGNWTIWLTTSKDETPMSLGTSSTLETALAHARAKLTRQKSKVSVPYITLSGMKATAYGQHAGNGDILVRVGGAAARINRYARSETLKAETPQNVVNRLKELREQTQAATREERQLIEQWKLDLHKAVEAALALKLSENASAEA